MFRADASRSGSRRRRRRWLSLALLLLIGILLGLLAPRAGTTIEFGRKVLFDLEREPAAPQFVASEYHDTHTTLWLLSARAPDGERRKLAEIPHANGWDIEAATSPSAATAAVLAIPPGGWEPANHAALLVVEAQGYRPIASGLDLRGGVVWSDDGRKLIVRRGGELVVLQADTGDQLASWSPIAPITVFAPIAMRGDTLFAALIESGGTSVVRLQLTRGTLTRLEQRQVSEEITRDWRLSPDGALVAFTEQRGLDLSVRVASLTDDVTDAPASWVSRRWTVGDPVGAAGSAHFPQSAAAVWRADGSLEVGSWADAVDGFSLPIAGDAGGEWLALRSVVGSGPGDVAAERLVLRDADGGLTEAPAGFQFVGWWSA